MSRLLDYIVGAIRGPHEQRTRGQNFVRNSWELTAHCWRQLQRHRAEGMAAELTYRTIFSLIPVVVLGLVTFRVVGGLSEVQSTVENQLYSFFGVPEIPVGYADAGSADFEAEVEAAEEEVATTETPSDESSAAGDPDADSGDEEPAVIDMEAAISATEQSKSSDTDEATRREARASMRRTLHDLTAKVAALDFKSIGIFGLLLFVYAAIALADSVEHLFNRIYDSPAQRPIHIRVAIHWSIITLGSVLLAVSLYMSGQVVEWFGEHGAGSTSRMLLRYQLSMSASWVLLFLLYALMPNTHVSIRAAAVGSLVGSILWEAAKMGFQIYVTKAVPYSAIYGSIGLIPLFLFWIYVTWVIVLFGLILTYTLQTLHGRPLSGVDRNEDNLPAGDPDWMLPIMSEVSHAFATGTTINGQELADRIGLSSRIVHEMTDRLVAADLLRQVTAGAGGEESLTLARPAEKITVGEILELAHQVRPTSDHPAWTTLAVLKRAEREAAAGKTLADLPG